jgi:hypothetical protein
LGQPLSETFGVRLFSKVPKALSPLRKLVLLAAIFVVEDFRRIGPEALMKAARP